MRATFDRRGSSAQPRTPRAATPCSGERHGAAARPHRCGQGRGGHVGPRRMMGNSCPGTEPARPRMCLHTAVLSGRPIGPTAIGPDPAHSRASWPLRPTASSSGQPLDERHECRCKGERHAEESGVQRSVHVKSRLPRAAAAGDWPVRLASTTRRMASVVTVTYVSWSLRGSSPRRAGAPMMRRPGRWEFFADRF